MPAKPLYSLAIACCMVAGLGSLTTADAKVRKGDRAADFVAVKNAKGKSVSLKSYKDRVVVLTFGASWCKPCGKELPAYEKLAKSYDAKKVTFIAVNIDSKIAKGKAFMKKAGVSKMLGLYDPKSSTVESYDPPTMPSTFVIKKGIVRYVHAGFRSGDQNKLKKIIDKNL
jgi:peroxiredoxin